jgi:hypothetical protein
MAAYLATCAGLALQRGAMFASAIVGAFALSTMLIARK